MKRCYKTPPPGVELSRLSGLLIVIEGPDSSGRSTQVRLLSEWLEQQGYAVAQVGLKRSNLVSVELEKAQEGNVLGPRTMSLFYATDFYDQFENNIVPALRAGYIVIADRYIFTLMARDIVRGADREYVENTYSRAIVPDAVFFLKVSTRNLVERTLESKGTLDYWESGMDIGLSRQWYASFVKYQQLIRNEFDRMREKYDFDIVNGDQSPEEVHLEIRARLLPMLERFSQE
ncbi:MAG: dTMP kinase [Planctomycetota bacterium]